MKKWLTLMSLLTFGGLIVIFSFWSIFSTQLQYSSTKDPEQNSRSIHFSTTKKLEEVQRELKVLKKNINQCKQEISKFVHGNETQFIEGHIEFKEKKEKEYIPIQNSLFPHKEKKGNIKVCAILAAFTDYGGVENWFQNLQQMIDNHPKFSKFQFYGVLITDFQTKAVLRYCQKQKIYLFEDIGSIYSSCHIVLNTGFHALNNPNLVDILVIHGSSKDPWTNRYAKYYRDYDQVVGISQDSGKGIMIFEKHRKKYQKIPSLVKKRTEECKKNERYKFCDNQLLFIGRISHEKKTKIVLFSCLWIGKSLWSDDWSKIF